MLRQIKAVSGVRSTVGVKPLFLCLLSAALLTLALSFKSCWILAWFSFVPLFLVVKNKSRLQSFLFFYITGLIFWGGTIYWLINVTGLGQIILIAYLALYFGFFGLLFPLRSKPGVLSSVFFVPSLWVALEYLRSHLLTGFPWALVGYSQYANLPVIQIADITGVWGVSFLVLMINTAIYSAIGRKVKSLLLPVLCLVVVLIYGYSKLYRTPQAAYGTPLKISVVQGNIPQALKWHSASREFIIERYFKLTDDVKADSPDLIIWPEASLPVVLEDEPDYFERLTRYVGSGGIPLLFGAVTNRDGVYYNSALLLSKEGKLSERYDKLHLVPFGEYIPFRNTFRFLETIVPIGDIASGRDYSLFSVPQESGYKFGVLICFEDIFPELGRVFVNKGAEFLVNITNDAWFGKTTEAAQHLAGSVFRSIENRVYVVRSANTGVSGFIDPQGRIISLVKDPQGNPIFTAGFATQKIYPYRKLTFYGRLGDYFANICLLILILSVIAALKRKGKYV